MKEDERLVQFNELRKYVEGFGSKIADLNSRLLKIEERVNKLYSENKNKEKV